MGITKDASTPATSTTIGGTNLSASQTSGSFSQVSASFSPPANSLVAILVVVGYGNTGVTWSTTGLTCSDSLSNSYSLPVSFVDGTSGFGLSEVAIFTHHYALAPGSITVTVTIASAEVNPGGTDINIYPIVLDGCASSQSGAATATFTGQNNTDAGEITITTTKTGSWVLLCGYDINAGTSALSDTTTAFSAADAVGNNFSFGYSSSATGTPGSTTFGWTNTNTFITMAALEILPAAAVGSAQVIAPEAPSRKFRPPPQVFTGQYLVGLTAAQAVINAYLASAGPALQLPTARVTVNAIAVTRGTVVSLPVAAVNVRAFAPGVPLVLPTARVAIQAPAPNVGAPGAATGLPVLFGSALGSGIYLPGTPGGAGGPGGPPAPGVSSITGLGSGWEVAVLAAPSYATELAVIPAKLITGLQFAQQLDAAGSGTVTMDMDDIWWGPGWSAVPVGTPAAGNYFICAAAQAAAIVPGDTFTWSGHPGTVFTVTEVVPTSAAAGPARSPAEPRRPDEAPSSSGTALVSARPGRKRSRQPAPRSQVITGLTSSNVNVYFTPAALLDEAGSAIMDEAGATIYGELQLTGGTVTSLNKAVLPNGQPAEYLLDFEHVWQVRESGVARFEFLGETVTEQLADATEQRIVTVTGPGTLATLQWAAVMPPGFPEVVFKLDALQDSFSEVNSAGQYVLDTGLWNASSATGVTLNPAGSARVTAVPGTTFLGSTAYDATQSLISAQVSPIVSPDPGGNTLDNSQVTQFYIQDIVKGYYILIGVSASSFYAKYSGPSGTFTQIIADIGTFSTAASGTQAYAFWQISELNGWFYVWTSADGNLWSKQYAIQHTGWNPTYVAFYFTAAYDVSGTEYATITSINSNVGTTSLGGPLYHNEPILATWLDQLTKAQARGTVPFVATGELSAAKDSFGNPWNDSQSVQLQNGTDLLALLQAHAGMINADYIMLPGFRLQVGIPAAIGKITLGYDRSQQIVFRDGNGAMVHTRQRQRNQIQNLIAAINADSRVATADNTGSASQWGQREGWLQAAVQVTEADIAIVAEAAVEQAGAEVLSYTLQILPGLAGHRIFSDFQVGDWVGLERPDFSAIDAVRVLAIAVQVNADGSEVHELALESYPRFLQEQLQYIATKMGGGFLNAAGTTAIGPGGGQLAPTIFSPTLVGLSDVSAPAPPGNAALVYDPVSGKWKPAGNAVSLTVAGVNGSTVIAGDGSGIQVNGSSIGASIIAAAGLSAGGDANIAGTVTSNFMSANSGSVAGTFSAGTVSSSSIQVGGATITATNFNMSPPMAIPPNYPHGNLANDQTGSALNGGVTSGPSGTVSAFPAAGPNHTHAMDHTHFTQVSGDFNSLVALANAIVAELINRGMIG